MFRRQSLMALAAVGAALTLAGQAHAQLLNSFVNTSNTTSTQNAGNSSLAGSNGSAFSTASTGQFFTGYSPVNVSQTPVNLTSTLQTGVNLQQAMSPINQAAPTFNIQSAFRNITFPLFRSTPVSVPIVQPGPNDPLQPTSWPAFHSITQTKTKS